MLRTNLSTRPFYNERAVHGVLGVTALIVVVAHDLQPDADRPVDPPPVVAQQPGDGGRDARDASFGRVRSRTRQAVNAKQIDTISSAAREANTIIGQRLFSWTDLLNRLETTLPDNVRITSLRPDVGRDGQSRSPMTVFAEASTTSSSSWRTSKQTTAFSEVYPIERRTGGGRRRTRQPRGKICTCPLGASSTTSAGWSFRCSQASR